MKGIKFRGKRANGSFIYGNYVHMHKTTGGWTTGIQMLASGEKYRAFASINVDPDSIAQFTNVHDDEDEGNELYEGDKITILIEGAKVTGKIERCGPAFLIVSDELEDGFIWMTDIMESDRNYLWIPGSKKIIE